ncbi:MAG: recombinase family protein [Acidobacteriia bacterium]|nr:recombinase family protein [Terriglobia bacterium]
MACGLNRDGIPSPRNGNWSSNAHSKWSLSTIREILRNPAYRGDTVWNRKHSRSSTACRAESRSSGPGSTRTSPGRTPRPTGSSCRARTTPWSRRRRSTAPRN